MKLFVIIPFFLQPISSKVHWNLYLCLRNIVSIIYSEEIALEWIEELEKENLKFMTNFKKLFPEESVTPKMHYMLHYPDLIRNFGPLIKFSTIKFERKHNYFKKLSQILRNFRNITLSLCNRHQKLQALRISENQK